MFIYIGFKTFGKHSPVRLLQYIWLILNIEEKLDLNVSIYNVTSVNKE